MARCGSYLQRPWYCIQSLPQSELLAKRHLEQQGFEVFYPEVIEATAKKQQIIRPMFSGYLFVCFDVSVPRWRSIYGTLFVKRVMSASAEEPIPLPWGFVEELQQRTDLHCRLDRRDQANDFVITVRENDEAVVAAGPLQGQRGICQFSSRERVDLLLQMLGGQRTISFHPRDVAPVHDLVMA